MPKIKTSRSAHKRFHYTGTGKVRRAHAGKSHILTKKNRKRKRRLRQQTLLDATNEKQIKRLMPYGHK